MAEDKTSSRQAQAQKDETTPAAGIDRATAQREDAVQAATEGDPDQHKFHKTGLVPAQALEKMEERARLGIPEPPKIVDTDSKLIDAGAGTFAVIHAEQDPADVGPGTVLGHYDPRELSDAKK
jgi:hypothetical protein